MLHYKINIIEKKPFISVGYKYDFPNEIIEIIKKERKEINVNLFTIDKRIYAGVYYGNNYNGEMLSQEKLNAWYEIRKNKIINGYIKKIYVMQSVVVLEIECGSNIFLSVPYYTNVSSSIHKANVFYNKYGAPINVNIPISMMAFCYKI